MKRKIAILGSTGSIGTQALDVIKEHSDKFEVYAITANNNADLLIRQAKEFLPEIVIIANDDKYKVVKDALASLPIKVWSGSKSISEVVKDSNIEVVLTAMVGYAGLEPTINAIKAKKMIALANKETLVVAGELIIALAYQYEVPIIPVDSEHSAIFQCLNGENSPIEKILLTASGGPFRKYSMEELATVTKNQALKHPNWQMGAKITIDSASLMNKGFEMIEAKWLFSVKPSQVQVVVHPQSIIHSMVQFEDSSIIAQLGMPDMRLPIQYAFTFPHRIKSSFERLDIFKLNTFTFEKADMKKFRNLAFAYQAAEDGGNMACIVNAANEIVVDAFLKDKIGFLKMSDIIESTMSKASFIKEPSYEDYVNSNIEARSIASELVNK